MRTFNITVNGQTYVVDVEEVGAAPVVRAAADQRQPMSHHDSLV